MTFVEAALARFLKRRLFGLQRTSKVAVVDDRDDPSFLETRGRAIASKETTSEKCRERHQSCVFRVLEYE